MELVGGDDSCVVGTVWQLMPCSYILVVGNQRPEIYQNGLSLVTVLCQFVFFYRYYQLLEDMYLFTEAEVAVEGVG